MLGIVAIRVTHLEGVDLNLLPPLAALLEERHVTRAAGRSGLSQPAMSRALARLRQVLDDQLLVRHGTGYVLTPRAKRQRLTLDEYLRCSHLMIDIIDGRQPVIDNRLRELGLTRRGALTLPLFVGAPATLPESNLVATLTERLMDRYGDDPAIAVVRAPVELEPMEYFMVWHPRLDHDPA